MSFFISFYWLFTRFASDPRNNISINVLSMYKNSVRTLEKIRHNQSLHPEVRSNEKYDSIT